MWNHRGEVSRVTVTGRLYSATGMPTAVVFIAQDGRSRVLRTPPLADPGTKPVKSVLLTPEDSGGKAQAGVLPGNASGSVAAMALGDASTASTWSRK